MRLPADLSSALGRTRLSDGLGKKGESMRWFREWFSDLIYYQPLWLTTLVLTVVSVVTVVVLVVGTATLVGGANCRVSYNGDHIFSFC